MDFHMKYEVGDRYLMGLNVSNVIKNFSFVTLKELHENFSSKCKKSHKYKK